jgi:hypothetical protein
MRSTSCSSGISVHAEARLLLSALPQLAGSFVRFKDTNVPGLELEMVELEPDPRVRFEV